MMNGYRNIILIPGCIQTHRKALIYYTQALQPKILIQWVQGNIYTSKLLLFKLNPQVEEV